jgi:hypothetical protein
VNAADRAELERLKAERAEIRRELASAVDSLHARARDPFGLKAQIRKHPVLAASLAAGAGAILVNLLLPPGGQGGGPAAHNGEPGASSNGRPSILDSLRDKALEVATPFIAQFVEEHLGGVLRPDEPRRADPD